MHRIGDVYEDLLFAGSNLEGEVLGTKETIAALGHEDFSKYINDWYGFKNVVFVVAGDENVVGQEELVSKVEQYLQKGGQDRAAHEHDSFFKENVYGSDRKAIVYKDTEQAHFILGFPTFPRSNGKKYPLSILSTLLGRTMSSRMFTQIRDNLGLCYYIRSGTDYYHDGGTFTASAGVDPNRISEALTATKQEFLKLHDTDPVTEQEIQGAKQNIIGNLLLQLEDSQAVAYWYGLKLLLEGQVQTTSEVVRLIEEVSLNQIQDIVKEVIDPEKMRVSLIGPYQAEDITIE